MFSGKKKLCSLFREVWSLLCAWASWWRGRNQNVNAKGLTTTLRAVCLSLINIIHQLATHHPLRVVSLQPQMAPWSNQTQSRLCSLFISVCKFVKKKSKGKRERNVCFVEAAWRSSESRGLWFCCNPLCYLIGLHVSTVGIGFPDRSCSVWLKWTCVPFAATLLLLSSYSEYLKNAVRALGPKLDSVPPLLEFAANFQLCLIP